LLEASQARDNRNVKLNPILVKNMYIEQLSYYQPVNHLRFIARVAPILPAIVFENRRLKAKSKILEK